MISYRTHMSMKRIVSGIQPTGDLHLGNYLGAIKNWQSLTTQGECYFFLADLHAITQPISAKKLRASVLDMTAMLMACGINNDNSTLFSQMRVPQHTELQWMLSCVARMGWLSRMTQFKDKAGSNGEDAFRAGFDAGWEAAEDSSRGYCRDADMAWKDYERKQNDSVGVGLFAYPILQAADILLYDATHVPVGDDQLQHLQLVRDIAAKFNTDYGTDLFTIPEPLLAKVTRVRSLKNGHRKMSKSDPDDMTRINIADDPDLIVKKYRRATTDTQLLPSEPEGLEGRAEVTNLVSILAALTDSTVADLLRELGGQGHGFLKARLADATIAITDPIRGEYNRLRGAEDHLYDELDRGMAKARQLASSKMNAVREAIFG